MKTIEEIIEKMDLECDETLDYLKVLRAENYDLDSEREEDIYLNGWYDAMQYFKKMLELRV